MGETSIFISCLALHPVAAKTHASKKRRPERAAERNPFTMRELQNTHGTRVSHPQIFEKSGQDAHVPIVLQLPLLNNGQFCFMYVFFIISTSRHRNIIFCGEFTSGVFAAPVNQAGTASSKRLIRGRTSASFIRAHAVS